MVDTASILNEDMIDKWVVIEYRETSLKIAQKG